VAAYVVVCRLAKRYYDVLGMATAPGRLLVERLLAYSNEPSTAGDRRQHLDELAGTMRGQLAKPRPNLYFRTCWWVRLRF
jgi:hypothetical protein